MDSLNLLNKSIEEKNNNSSSQNNGNEFSKNKIIRSKTQEEKRIEEIKNQIFQSSKANINNRRKTQINFKSNFKERKNSSATNSQFFGLQIRTNF